MYNDYLTVYHRDYVPKKITSLKEEIETFKKNNKEFRDPINEGFRNYLCLDVDPCPEPSDEINSYFEKAVNVYPQLKFATGNIPVDKQIIGRKLFLDKGTKYQIDYCDLEKIHAEKEYFEKTRIKLPNDTIVPLTTQKASFRVPRSIKPNVYQKTEYPRPQNSLDPKHNIREILQVTTGESAYTDVIGKLGRLIMEEQLHGIPKLL